MKVLNTRWRLIALVPLVAIAILSIGNRIGAVADQNREVDWGDNGFIIQGGITQGQILRFNVSRLASVAPGPPNSNAHPGGNNLELRVFDSQGNVVASNTFVFSNQNQNGGGVWKSSFFDLNAAQLPAGVFDSTGRAELTGVVKYDPDTNNPNKPPNPNCGFVASGEIFDIGTGRTLIHIAGSPILSCRKADPFLTESFSVTVARSGGGSGSVISSPSGIDCGSICTASYDSNTVVTLTAAPNSGSTFSGWGGACVGTGACTLTMDSAKSVIATFKR